MKKTSTKSGFSPNCLPLSRKAQFKDQIKLNYFLFLKVGFMLFLFALPLIACLLLDKLVIIYYANPEITDKSGALMYGLIFDVGKMFGLGIFAIALAGVLNIYKRCMWNQPVMFGYDFKQGVKEHAKRLFWIAFIIGLYFVLTNFMFNYSSIINTNNTVSFVAFILLLSLFAFVIFPIALMMIFLAIYYRNKFRSDMKNGFILTIKVYIPFIFIAILGTIAFFISFLGSAPIMLVLYAVYFILILPIYLLITNLFTLNLFDEYINQDFKEYQYKGLYHKEENTK